jgi:hypothetical protein
LEKQKGVVQRRYVMNTPCVLIISTGLITLSAITKSEMPFGNGQSISEKIIYVETSLGDFIDKITILQIKRERIKDSVKLINITIELESLIKTYHAHVQASKTLDELMQQLLQVNKNLWDLEDAVRLKERNKQFDQEFIGMIDAILTNNDRRACLKRSINLLCRSRIIEEKSYNHIKSVELKTCNMTDNVIQSVSLAVATPLGDLVDRITILMIKKMRIDEPEKHTNIMVELGTLETILASVVRPSAEFDVLKNDLLKANEIMWDIQDKIRVKKQLGQFDDEFINLGRSVYYTNDKRCAIKRSINDLVCSQLIEEKCYTFY